MAGICSWQTLYVRQETPNTITITFDTKGKQFNYLPGQYINITKIIEGKKVTRSYSLSSMPDSDQNPSITIKKVPQGLMSNFVFDKARDIAEWHVEGPHGFFHPSPAALESAHIVFIGGGSGITPLFSQLQYFLTNTSACITLINCNRNSEQVIFKQALSDLESNYPERLEIWHLLSRQAEENSSGFNHIIHSRLSKLLLKKILKKRLPTGFSDAYYFLCGPAALIEMSEAALLEWSVPKIQINKEYFEAPESEPATTPLPDQPFEVLLHYQDQTNLLEVTPGQSILDAALGDHIKLPYSCKNGTCGQCAGKLVQGQIHMTKNYSLPQHLLDDGFILLCQSHPINNEVTVEALPALS